MAEFARLKMAFFDSELVLKIVDEGLRKTLSQLGAYIRTRARSSLRYRAAKSPVGSPPSVHKSQGFTRKRIRKGVESQQPSSPLKDLIFFAWDFATKSMVAGPVLFQNRGYGPRGLDLGDSTVPEIVEHGGQETLHEKTKTRTLNYGPHPFMRPARDAEMSGKLGPMLKGMATRS